MANKKADGTDKVFINGKQISNERAMIILRWIRK